MKTANRLILFSLLIIGMSACSPRLTPFTQDLYSDNNWSEGELKKIQFYLSRDIRLYRDFTEGSSKIEGGKIRMVKGRKVEEVVIPNGTPGLMVFSPKDDRLAVSFEDNDDRFLMFGPNKKIGERYVLLAKEWSRSRGKVSYEGTTWYTDSESAYAALMVDLKKIKRTKVKSRVAEGRKL